MSNATCITWARDCGMGFSVQRHVLPPYTASTVSSILPHHGRKVNTFFVVFAASIGRRGDADYASVRLK